MRLSTVILSLLTSRVWSIQLRRGLPPSRDPFYTAPEGYADVQPGTILRMRVAPGNPTAFVTNSSGAYNILFRTTDSNYRAAWAVTTLFLPIDRSNEDNATANQLLTYLVPYDSSNVDSSPSYYIYTSAPENVIPKNDIAASLGHGWYVNVPDYEGPLASYSAGVASGHATLDSVRAARAAAAGLGLCSDPRSAMWGYSGGALAGEWAAELQVQYAPELNFVGMAIGGVTPNDTNVELSVDGQPYALLIPDGLIGLSRQHPVLSEFLDASLKPTGPHNASFFKSIANMTFDEALVAFANQTISDYFTMGAAFYYAPIPQKFANIDGQMGYHGVPKMPLFVYKAIHDEISPVGDTDKLVSSYCGVGANIWYQRNTIGGHVAEETNGNPRAMAFLVSVLDDTYNRAGCTVENVTIAISTTSQ